MGRKKISEKSFFVFPMIMKEEVLNAELDRLNLSNRALNAFMRAGYKTVGDIVDYTTCTADLLKLKGLGDVCAADTMLQLFLFQYEMLGAISAEKQDDYLKRVVDMSIEYTEDFQNIKELRAS